jgi:hypothetical protein
MTYSKVSRNSIETPTITANNIQKHTLIKIMQESFTMFETILSKQAEQMNTLMNLLTIILKQISKIIHVHNIVAWNANGLTQRMKEAEVFLNTKEIEKNCTEQNYVHIPN